MFALGWGLGAYEALRAAALRVVRRFEHGECSEIDDLRAELTRLQRERPKGEP